MEMAQNQPALMSRGLHSLYSCNRKGIERERVGEGEGYTCEPEVGLW